MKLVMADLLINHQLFNRIGKSIPKPNKKCATSEVVIRAITSHGVPFVIMLRPAFLEHGI